jgi:hypothetical protein
VCRWFWKEKPYRPFHTCYFAVSRLSAFKNKRGNLKRKDHLEVLNVDERVILKCTYSVVYGLDSSDSGYSLVAGCSEHSNETSGSMTGKKFLNQLINCQLQEERSWLEDLSES